MGLQALGLFFGAEAISTEAFAALNPDATGIAIGALMHEVLAVLNMTVAIILLSARDLPEAGAAKVLMGTAVGLFITLAHGYYNLMATETKPPLPILILMTVLMALAVVTSRKAAAADEPLSE